MKTLVRSLSAASASAHHESQQPERDMKATEQAGRGEHLRGAFQASLAVLETVLPDLARLTTNGAYEAFTGAHPLKAGSPHSG